MPLVRNTQTKEKDKIEEQTKHPNAVDFKSL